MNTPPQPLVTGAHVVDTNAHRDVIAAAIANYHPEVPNRLWSDEVQEFTRSAVTDFAPATVGEARSFMSVVAHLAIWTVDVACESLERDVVFNGQNIDAHITNATKHNKADQRRLKRLRLLRFAAQLDKFEPERRERRRNLGPRGRSLGYTPYTPAELVRFRNQGSTRSTAHRRRNWMVLLSLAAGCALTATEIVHLRASDVQIETSHVAVHVRGNRARTVICRAEWEDDIRAFMQFPNLGEYLLAIDYVAEHAGQGSLVTGRPNVPSAFVETFLKRSADDPKARFSVERLRTTWIVSHLEEHTDPVSLIRTLGDKAFSSLTRVMPYVRTPDEAEMISMFRGGARL
jgi:integrase